MGLLSFFSRASAPATLIKLPTGSFSVDRSGKVVASTLPQTFPAEHVKNIAGSVLSAFLSAQNAGLPITEMVIEYASFKLTARELRGGAIIFLAPRSLTQR